MNTSPRTNQSRNDVARRLELDEVFKDETYAKLNSRIQKRAAKKQQSATELKVNSFLTAIDYDVKNADSWNRQKQALYFDVLCQRFGIENWCIKPNVGKNRAAKEVGNLLAVLVPEEFKSKSEAILFFEWIFSNWDQFTRSYPKAKEVGFCPPFWAKAWPQMKKFKNQFDGFKTTEPADTKAELDSLFTEQ